MEIGHMMLGVRMPAVHGVTQEKRAAVLWYVAFKTSTHSSRKLIPFL